MADRQTAMVAVNLQTIRHTTAGGHGIRGRNCPFLLHCSTMPTHYSTPPPGPRKSYSNPRIPGGICSIHESEIPGRRAKGTFERICGIRSRHPMSHCAVVTSSPFDKQPFCSFRFETTFRTRLASRPGQQTAPLSAPFSPVPSNFSALVASIPIAGSIPERHVRETRIAISFHRASLRMSPFTHGHRPGTDATDPWTIERQDGSVSVNEIEDSRCSITSPFVDRTKPGATLNSRHSPRGIEQEQ